MAAIMQVMKGWIKQGPRLPEKTVSTLRRKAVRRKRKNEDEDEESEKSLSDGESDESGSDDEDDEKEDERDEDDEDQEEDKDGEDDDEYGMEDDEEDEVGRNASKFKDGKRRQPRVKYNNHKMRTRTQHLYLTATQLEEVALGRVVLIPVRLELENEGVKIRDTFTWNLNEPFISPERFAETFLQDLDPELYPPQTHTTWIPMIADAIRQQCDTYRADAEYDLMMHGHHHPHHHHQQHHQLRDDGMRLELPMAVEPPFPVVYGGLHDKDARVVVKLDVHLGHFHLRDAFEWPIYPHVPAPSPEEFAKNLTADLGVGGEFAPLISHSIREQVLEARAREAYAPSVRKQVVRPYDVDEYGATLREVSDAEMEKLEREREREARKNRRSQRASLRSTRNSRNASIPYDLSKATGSSPPASSQPAFIPYRNYVPTAEELEIQRRYNPKMHIDTQAYHKEDDIPKRNDCHTLENNKTYPTSASHESGLSYPSQSNSSMGQYDDMHLYMNDMDHGALLPLLQSDGPLPPLDTRVSHDIYDSPLSAFPYPQYSYQSVVPTPETPNNYQLPSPISPLDARPSTLTASQRLIIEGALGMVEPPAPILTLPVAPSKKAKKPKVVVKQAEDAREMLGRQLELMQRGVGERPSEEAVRRAIERRKGGEVKDDLGKKHRGFGASANVFNQDGSIDVGEFRRNWHCSWCLMSGKYTPTLRKGPLGSKTLCNACGIWFGKHGTMPEERYHYHADQVVFN